MLDATRNLPHHPTVIATGQKMGDVWGIAIGIEHSRTRGAVKPSVAAGASAHLPHHHDGFLNGEGWG